MIGELTDTWAYALLDGSNTARQQVDANGATTLAAAYTPWGDTLSVQGTGSFTFGYLGGLLDAASGLLYVGNAQYYDPKTGRFLTRDAKPNQSNPYVPWKSDPAGAMLAPIALLAMVYGKKKNRGKWDQLVIVVVLCLTTGMALTACSDSTPTPIITVTPTPISTPTPNPTATVTVTVTATFPTSASSPTPTLTITCSVTLIPTLTPNDGDALNSNGYKAKGYYDDLNSKSGWWNKHNVGGFTIEQFLGIFMLYEADGHRADTGDKVEYYIKEVVGYELWANTKLDNRGGNSPYCTDEPCFNGVLNFMGGYQGGYLMTRFDQITDDMNNSNGHPRLDSASFFL